MILLTPRKRHDRPAKIPTSTSLEIRNYITQSETYDSHIQEEQYSLRTSVSGLQAEFQRFRADIEARPQQADNSATPVVQAENQQLRDQLAIASNPTLSDLVGPSSTALENPSTAVNTQSWATTLPLLSVSDMLKHYEAAIRSGLFARYQSNNSDIVYDIRRWIHQGRAEQASPAPPLPQEEGIQRSMAARIKLQAH
jgi:hypothetical protein